MTDALEALRKAAERTSKPILSPGSTDKLVSVEMTADRWLLVYGYLAAKVGHLFDNSPSAVTDFMHTLQHALGVVDTGEGDDDGKPTPGNFL